MQQLATLWQALDPRKRIIVAVATVAMFAAVYALTSLASRPSMALLYAGIDGSRAGEVLAALDQRAIKYEVRGQAIYVESTRRDELRMDLASEGLPANEGSGYELLDSLSGFGTTSQMFDAAYWRAKEGELARTIAALPNVRSVRVHIANVEPEGFRARSAPKASVTVVTRDGSLSTKHARALKFLVSAAVAGMTPQDVAIIDGEGNLVQGDADDGGKSGDDRAAYLRENVTRILEARVGSGNAVVEVVVEAVTDSEAISERILDPQKRIAISTENQEKTTSSNNSGSSAVGVASNLPSGNATGSGKSSQSNDSQTTERVNYEVSETKRDLVRNPGAIKRLTVAVLVDGIESKDSSGQVQWQPRPEEELTALSELVAAAVGLDATRGDVLTLKSLAFEPVSSAGVQASGSWIPAFAIDVMSLVQLMVLALVTLALGLFVLRPILMSRSGMASSHAALPAPGKSQNTEVLHGIIDDGEFDPRAMTSVGSASANRTEIEEVVDPVARLRRLISERQEESVEILRSWMDDPEEENA